MKKQILPLPCLTGVCSTACAREAQFTHLMAYGSLGHPLSSLVTTCVSAQGLPTICGCGCALLMALQTGL